MPRRWLWTEVCLALIVALCVPYLLIRPALARELLCQIPEHTHTDSCYTQLPAELGEGEDGDPSDQPLACTITDETHVHGPRCYGTWVLTCGLEEHTHTEACYSTEDTLPGGDADASETPAGSETGGDAPTGDPADPDTQADGTLEVSLLYGDGSTQDANPDGVGYYTHSTMAGFIRLEPKDLDADPTGLTVTLSMPKQYVEKDSIRIPPFSTNFTVTEYTIGSVEENGENYTISIYFTVYDRTQTLMLPTYTDRNGVSRIAVFDADQNPGWTLSEDGKAVSRTYTGEHSAEILLQIYNDALHLRFPGLQFTALADGTLEADLDNTVHLEAIPSGEAPGETHPEADDPLRFRLTTAPTAYYTDGTTETISALQADAHGNITVTFDEEKVCDGYDIVFAEDYEMQAGGQVRFHAYTVYRDPEHTHVPDGQAKVTYTNAARSINSYPLDGETDDKIAYAFSDATIIAAQSMYAEKFIAPARSGSWSKQGLLVKAGSDFDYLLEIVNETAAVHTGLTVYDTLPRIGDPNLFGASGRGSEFPVRLRSAITPPEGYTVYYTTSPEVYTHSMEEMVSAEDL